MMLFSSFLKTESQKFVIGHSSHSYAKLESQALSPGFPGIKLGTQRVGGFDLGKESFPEDLLSSVTEMPCLFFFFFALL